MTLNEKGLEAITTAQINNGGGLTYPQAIEAYLEATQTADTNFIKTKLIPWLNTLRSASMKRRDGEAAQAYANIISYLSREGLRDTKEPTDADVERVAEAIYRHDRNSYGNWEWEKLNQPDLFAGYLSKAKAAIAALTNNEKGK